MPLTREEKANRAFFAKLLRARIAGRFDEALVNAIDDYVLLLSRDDADVTLIAAAHPFAHAALNDPAVIEMCQWAQFNDFCFASCLDDEIDPHWGRTTFYSIDIVRRYNSFAELNQRVYGGRVETVPAPTGQDPIYFSIGDIEYRINARGIRDTDNTVDRLKKNYIIQDRELSRLLEYRDSRGEINTDELKGVLSQITTFRQQQSMSAVVLHARDAAQDPSIKEYLTQQRLRTAGRRLWGKEHDFRDILGDQITLFKGIERSGSYILAPIQYETASEKIKDELENIKAHNIDGVVSIHIPVTTNSHWTLLSVTIRNKQIASIEHSNSIGFGKSTQVVTNENHRQILSQFGRSLSSQDFAPHAIFTQVGRDEQHNGWNCMDHTLIEALRKKGMTLRVRDRDTGTHDIISLEHRAYSDPEDALKLRHILENIILTRVSGEPIERLNIPSSISYTFEEDYILLDLFVFLIDAVKAIILLPYMIFKEAWSFGIEIGTMMADDYMDVQYQEKNKVSGAWFVREENSVLRPSCVLRDSQRTPTAPELLAPAAVVNAAVVPALR